jgi:hypothetical protein
MIFTAGPGFVEVEVTSTVEVTVELQVGGRLGLGPSRILRDPRHGIHWQVGSNISKFATMVLSLSSSLLIWAPSFCWLSNGFFRLALMPVAPLKPAAGTRESES